MWFTDFHGFSSYVLWIVLGGFLIIYLFVLYLTSQNCFWTLRIWHIYVWNTTVWIYEECEYPSQKSEEQRMVDLSFQVTRLKPSSFPIIDSLNIFFFYFWFYFHTENQKIYGLNIQLSLNSCFGRFFFSILSELPSFNVNYNIQDADNWYL